MMKSFWKTVPALALALSVGGYAHTHEVALAELAGKDRVVGRSRSGTVPCGIVEGNQCYARGCSMAMGGAFEFEFLYWRAENSGFQAGWMATGPIALIGTTTNTRFAAKPVTVEPEWNPGFRLGMGWNTTWDRWDLFFDWTWYKNHSNADASTNDTSAGRGLYPTGSGVINSGDLTGPYRALHSSWKLWHNCFDMELGRAYYLTRQLSLRNHWGLRGAVLKQKGSSTFSDPISTSPVGTPLGAETLRLLNKFSGVGPRAGLQTRYHVGKGFSVVGKGAVTLLFGQQKWKSKDWGYAAGSPTAFEVAKTGDKTQTLVPNLNLFFGMEWATCFSCEEISFGMEAGWEANYWMNQYAISTLQSKATNNPVTMEGLTVSFHIDY